MAITLLQEAQDYMPAFNPVYFSASSTQTAQPNFKYTIVIIDVITSQSQIYDVLPAPSGKLEGWNAQSFLSAFMTTDLVFLLAGWQKYASVRKYQVNIGETYDVSGTPTYFTGATKSYFTWNAHLGFLTFAQYSPANYVYNDPNQVYLAGVTDDITFVDRSSYLYILVADSVPTIQGLRVDTFDASGSAIGTSYIKNPYGIPADYTEKYLSIDIGYKGLLALTSPLVTGVFPIITPNVSSYKIYDVNILSFQTETCLIGGLLSIHFSSDPGLSVGNTFFYTIKTPGTTGSPASGTMTITAVTGGGNYTTDIPCTNLVASIDGGDIYFGSPTFIKQYAIKCAQKYPVYTVHFKARDGSFGTCNFNRLPDTTSQKEETIYQVNPNSFVNNAYGYAYESGTEQSLSVSDKTYLNLRTDWITDEQLQKYKECFTSPVCYLDLGSSRYKRIRPLATLYTDYPQYDKLVQLTIQFTYSHQSFRDDGQQAHN